jgi:hypothetical protein
VYEAKGSGIFREFLLPGFRFREVAKRHPIQGLGHEVNGSGPMKGASA